MIGSRYRIKKAAVLDVWKRYLAFRGDLEDGIDLSFLENRAEALEAGKYILAVVGESKAGKSTLINALLGERILPTDILQSSSAIVEIFKSEKKYVKVIFSDNSERTVEDDPSTPDIDEAFEYLRSIGALSDRFRRIPTTLIDSYIVDGRITPDDFIPIEDLEAESNLPLKGKEDLIKEYVEERRKTKIPVEVKFGFPLKYDFDELCLVDSPGVNALGGVQKRTYGYLHNAHAILFVHSLEGPVDKGSFREFITQTIPNHTPHSLFLVLSKSGFKSKIEIEEKINEAHALFSQEFDSSRILYVDSMLKIMSDEILEFENTMALKSFYIERKKHFEHLYESERRQEWRDEAVSHDTKLKLLSSVLEVVDGIDDREKIQKELRHLSNFDLMEKVIEEFSSKAPEIQLFELLSTVKRGYDNQTTALEQNIDLLKKKKKHPQSFENEISEIQRLLEEYHRELNEFTQNMLSRFTGVNSENRTDLNGLKQEHEGRINQAENDTSIRNNLIEFNDKCDGMVAQFAEIIKKCFADKLEQLGAEFKDTHKMNVPKPDIDSIAGKAKQNAYRDEAKKSSTRAKAATGGGLGGAGLGALIGSIFGPAGTAIGAAIGAAIGGGGGYVLGDDEVPPQKVFDEKMYIMNLKSESVALVQHVTDVTVPSIMSTFINQHIESFKNSVHVLITQRTAILEEIKTKKESNEEILHRISAEEKKKKDIFSQISLINDMMEDLK